MVTDCRWHTRSLLTSMICALALLAAPADARAQQRPCQDDIKKLCPEVRPGTPEARQCLKANIDKLSEACRQRVSAARGRQGYPPRLKACEADLDKFCKGTMAGGGRLMRCLREHQSELSSECKTNLPSGRGGGGPKGGGASGGGADSGGGTAQGSGPGAATAAAQPTVQATVQPQ